MSNAWWDRGDRTATPQGIALKAAAAFLGVLTTLAIWWPAGIAVAVVVCTAATVVANRMLEAGEPTTDRGLDLAALLGAAQGGEPA